MTENVVQYGSVLLYALNVFVVRLSSHERAATCRVLLISLSLLSSGLLSALVPQQTQPRARSTGLFFVDNVSRGDVIIAADVPRLCRVVRDNCERRISRLNRLESVSLFPRTQETLPLMLSRPDVHSPVRY